MLTSQRMAEKMHGNAHDSYVYIYIFGHSITPSTGLLSFCDPLEQTIISDSAHLFCHRIEYSSGKRLCV